mgnify:CR=1 FL=1
MIKRKHIGFIIILIGLLGCTKTPALKVYSLDTPTISAVHGNTYKNKSIKNENIEETVIKSKLLVSVLAIMFKG